MKNKIGKLIIIVWLVLGIAPGLLAQTKEECYQNGYIYFSQGKYEEEMCIRDRPQLLQSVHFKLGNYFPLPHPLQRNIIGKRLIRYHHPGSMN